MQPAQLTICSRLWCVSVLADASLVLDLQLINLRDFQPATVDDICSVHMRAYVQGLQKAAAAGADMVEYGAPTYCTPSTYDDALRVSLTQADPQCRAHIVIHDQARKRASTKCRVQGLGLRCGVSVASPSMVSRASQEL